MFIKRIPSFIKATLFLSIFFFNLSAHASDKEEIQNILKLQNAPQGVVFELIGRENSTYLPNALKKIETYKAQLQKKFPKIKISVVSHGSEQFELTKAKAKQEVKSHSLVKRITSDDVPVHICGNHASWRSVGAKDFPDYISVVAAAPTQIKKYQALGYLLVIVN